MQFHWWGIVGREGQSRQPKFPYNQSRGHQSELGLGTGRCIGEFDRPALTVRPVRMASSPVPLPRFKGPTPHLAKYVSLILFLPLPNLGDVGKRLSSRYASESTSGDREGTL